MLCAIRNLPQDLVAVGPERSPHIWHFSLNDLNKQGRNLLQEGVAHVVVPCGNEYSVLRLQDKVVRNIINDDRFIDVTAQQTQVFHKERPILRGMLTVQPVLDVLVDVDLVYHLVCVVLEGSRENDNLVELSHQLNKVYTPGANKEVAVRTILNVVDKGLIEIKDQGVLRLFGLSLKRRQEGRCCLWKISEVIWKFSCAGACNS